MRNFLFMIGSTDDFDSQEALERALDPRSDEARGNHSTFYFSAPEDLGEDVITMIGRGHAFSADWSMDGTISFCMEVTI